MIRVRCPRCAADFAVEDEMRGRMDRCPHCATPVPVLSGPTAEVIVHRETHVRVPLTDADIELREEFDRYLAAIANAIPLLNLFDPIGPGADLLLTITLGTGGKPDCAAAAQPADSLPDPAALARLFVALLAVRPPVTRGPAVEVALRFAVRGGWRG